LGAAKNDATGAKEAGAYGSGVIGLAPSAAATHEQKTHKSDAEQHSYCAEATLQRMKYARSEVHRG
jgi:hypothetical protein